MDENELKESKSESEGAKSSQVQSNYVVETTQNIISGGYDHSVMLTAGIFGSMVEKSLFEEIDEQSCVVSEAVFGLQEETHHLVERLEEFEMPEESFRKRETALTCHDNQSPHKELMSRNLKPSLYGTIESNQRSSKPP